MGWKKSVFHAALYGGITKSEFESIKPMVLQKNRETLTLASAMCTVMFFILTAASFFSASIMEARLFYALMTAFCLVLCVLSATVVKRRLWMALPLWYVLYFLFGSYAVLLNTLIRPHLSATTLCAFLVAAPLLIIDRPWRVIAFMGGISLAFVVSAHQLKDGYLAFTDSINVACCLFIGAAIYSRLVRVKLRETMQACLLKRERDTDKLTGLLNKTAFEEQMDERLHTDGQQGSFVVFDADNFKHINDSYGHIFGDMVLQRTAACVREVFPEKEVLLGRFGGDEFVLFLPDSILPERMEHLMGLLKKELVFPDPQERMSISAGVAVYPRDGVDYVELFRKADQAMYHAKGAGKDCLRFYTAPDGAK